MDLHIFERLRASVSARNSGFDLKERSFLMVIQQHSPKSAYFSAHWLFSICEFLLTVKIRFLIDRSEHRFEGDIFAIDNEWYSLLGLKEKLMAQKLATESEALGHALSNAIYENSVFLQKLLKVFNCWYHRIFYGVQKNSWGMLLDEHQKGYLL